MTVDSAVRDLLLQQAQGAASLSVAYVGVANRLFDALSDGALTRAELAARSGMDAGYVAAWCDAAFAFGHVDETVDGVELGATGHAFVRGGPDSMFSVPVSAVLGAHMAERAAFYSRTGERPGEAVLAERETILPLFGPMLEQGFSAMFSTEVAITVPVFAELAARQGLVVDLGCGNGWYLRALLHRFPGLRGVGMDGFAENVSQAQQLAHAEGLGARVEFRVGDLRSFAVAEPVDLIAMNRSLHHVWESGPSEVFRLLRDRLAPGGAAVIWEPAWPTDRALLRTPAYRVMAFQNLSEHVQGNHFLRSDEIEAAFEDVGMTATTWRFHGGSEAVVVGRRR